MTFVERAKNAHTSAFTGDWSRGFVEVRTADDTVEVTLGEGADPPARRWSLIGPTRVPGRVAKLEEWCATRVPLLLMIDEVGEAQLSGPQATVTDSAKQANGSGCRARNIASMTSVPGHSPVAALGLHHVRLPVSDVMRSRDWYADVLGFQPRLCLEEEKNVIGAVVAQPGGLTLGLHYAPGLARELHGFCSIALSVGTLDDLTRWCARLDTLGISHSVPADGHLGWYVEVPDPDGLVIQLHTVGQPSADEA